MRKVVFSLILGAALAGCTDGNIARFSALGDAGHITCYSGGTVIYDGKSTGKIGSEESSDGWYFMEEGTKKLIRVSGDCVIRN